MRAKYLAVAAAAALLGAGAGTAWMSMHGSPKGAGSGSSLAQAATDPNSDTSLVAPAGPEVARALPARQWKPGDSFVYAVDTVHRTSVEGQSPSGQKAEVRLTGSLALTVVGRDVNGVQLRGELRSPRHGQTPTPERDSSASLVEPFYLTARPTGEMTTFYFAKGVPGEIRMLLKALTTSLQLAVPALSPEAWRATEQDASGEYEATYRASGGVVHKAKLKYLRARGLAGLIALPEDAVYSVKSAIDFEIDKTGWPRTAVEDETLDVTMHALRIIATSRTTAKLVSTASNTAIAGRMNDADFESDMLSDAAASALAKKQADKGLVDGKTFKDLEVDLSSSDVHLRNRTQARMAALFRVDPTAARAAEDAILRGSIDENAKKRLLSALGGAGTPEAQQALASILATTDAPKFMRTDAAVALGLSKEPTIEVEQALGKAMDSPDKVVADTATLATGSMIRTMNTEQSVDPKDAVETLIELLQKAVDDNQRALCLQALGNTGDLRALAAIQPYLTHADTVLREIATSSLRFMPGSETDALVIAAMADKDATVRTAAVGTVPFRPVAPVFSTLEELLHKEHEVSVRLAIVNALNMKRKEDPSVDVALTWAAEKDPSSAVKLLAQQVLGMQP